MCQSKRQPEPTILTINADHIDLNQVIDVARLGDSAKVIIDDSEFFIRRLEASRQALNDALQSRRPVYGVSTGYGKSCGNWVGGEGQQELGRNLIRYHGCGVGEPLEVEQVRAAILCRIISLAKCYSGVRRELLVSLADLLNAGITPVVPRDGSVGASGDLTPMSYIAACLLGEREAFYKGERLPTAEAMRQAGLKPLDGFAPKEPLALLNGTSIMTGTALMVLHRSQLLMNSALLATALSVHGLAGHVHHFHPKIAEVKPHKGQKAIADRLRGLLHTQGNVPETNEPEYLQDPYSVRCSPQILGVLYDTLESVEQWLETELNSANDNPLFDPDTGEMLTGGNFYGGHVAQAMDSLKIALASVADMCDRQIALLVDPRFNRGLPGDLVGASAEDRYKHHGFKGLQITATALTVKAQKLAMPASVFSRSTESHNQDKVSLGTHAALDASDMCALLEQILAIHLLVSAQACRLRGAIEARPLLAKAISILEKISPPHTSDRPMDTDIQKMVKMIKSNVIDRCLKSD